MNIEREYRKFKINKFKEAYGYKFRKNDYKLFQVLHNTFFKLKKYNKDGRVFFGYNTKHIVIECSTTTCWIENKLWNQVEDIKHNKTEEILEEVMSYLIGDTIALRKDKLHVQTSDFTKHNEYYSKQSFEEV